MPKMNWMYWCLQCCFSEFRHGIPRQSTDEQKHEGSSSALPLPWILFVPWLKELWWPRETLPKWHSRMASWPRRDKHNPTGSWYPPGFIQSCRYWQYESSINPLPCQSCFWENARLLAHNHMMVPFYSKYETILLLPIRTVILIPFTWNVCPSIIDVPWHRGLFQVVAQDSNFEGADFTNAVADWGHNRDTRGFFVFDGQLRVCQSPLLKLPVSSPQRFWHMLCLSLPHVPFLRAFLSHV